MNFFGIGTGELMLIMLIALLVLGPERLPAFIRQVTKAISQVRSVANEITQELNRELNLEEYLDIGDIGLSPESQQRSARTKPAASGGQKSIAAAAASQSSTAAKGVTSPETSTETADQARVPDLPSDIEELDADEVAATPAAHTGQSAGDATSEAQPPSQQPAVPAGQPAAQDGAAVPVPAPEAQKAPEVMPSDSESVDE